MTGRERLVVANVILRAASGKSVRDAGRSLSHRTVHEFLPTRETLDAARHKLAQLGFHIDWLAETHLTISGTTDLFEQVFHVRLIQRQSPFIVAPDIRAKHPHYVTTVAPQIPAELSAVIEFIGFPGPVKYHTSPTPPTISYYYLTMPGDIAQLMDASRAHAYGIMGAGIKLAIVDSGFMMPWHPYYMGSGYHIQPVVSDSQDPNPGDDLHGHGTAITACALAVAPGVTLTVYKAYLDNNAAAFARAVAGQPHIISCSWELDVDHALRLAINHAVSKGIVVVVSCGNEGPVGWPGYEPAVISVGGTFVAKDGTIEASDYASSGPDPDDPARHVPDLCGIVGKAPHGVLIALPTQPNSDRDRAGAQSGPYPMGDETAPDDGWSVFSGTSCGAPMVAGAAALVMQADPSTVGNPEAIRARLKSSCIDVTIGKSASGEEAAPGPDPATGTGLVQGYRAIREVVEQHGRPRKHEGGTKMSKPVSCAGDGGEIRAYLLMHVHDPRAAAKELHGLVLERQWNPEWSIKRVDTVDHDASSKLTKFPAPPDCHNLLVAVKAAHHSALENAFNRIADVVKPSAARDPHGHIVTSSTYLDWGG